MTVTESTQMSIQLINVIGLRLAQMFILDANTVSLSRQSSLPASLITWLKVLVRSLFLFASNFITRFKKSRQTIICVVYR